MKTKEEIYNEKLAAVEAAQIELDKKKRELEYEEATDGEWHYNADNDTYAKHEGKIAVGDTFPIYDRYCYRDAKTGASVSTGMMIPRGGETR